MTRLGVTPVVRSDVEFCDHCDVSMDLHSMDDPDARDCALAVRKAKFMSDFFWFLGGAGGPGVADGGAS